MLVWSLLVAERSLLCLSSAGDAGFRFSYVTFSDCVLDDVDDYFNVLPGVVEGYGWS